MSPTGQMVACGALGLVLGAVGALLLPRLLMREHMHQRLAQLLVAITTAGALTLLSLRLDEWPTLLTPAVMTVFGIPLAAVDLLEQRLPNVLLAAAYPMVAAAIVASAIKNGQTADIILANLHDRKAEAETQGWRGEIAGLEVSIAAAEQKLTAMRELTARHRVTHLGMPDFGSVTGRATTESIPCRPA